MLKKCSQIAHFPLLLRNLLHTSRELSAQHSSDGAEIHALEGIRKHCDLWCHLSVFTSL